MRWRYDEVSGVGVAGRQYGNALHRQSTMLGGLLAAEPRSQSVRFEDRSNRPQRIAMGLTP